MRLEHQFQALLAGAPDALIIADVAGHILIANSQAEQLFGYAASELIGQPVDLLLPLALHTRHVQHRADYGRSGAPSAKFADAASASAVAGMTTCSSLNAVMYSVW